MRTAKVRGFRKGDWVLIRGYGWEAKILSGVNTAIPTVLVFGIVTEAGSMPADELVMLPYSEQELLEEKHEKVIKRFKTPLTHILDTGTI